MKIELDVRGRINQWNQHTFMAFTNKKCYSIFIDKEIKNSIRKQFGNVTDFVEKFHCMGLYYLIKGSINVISEMTICIDFSKKKILKYLKDYFSNSKSYNNIKKDVRSIGKRANVHKFLRKLKRKDVNLKLTYSMIANKLR